MVWPFFGLFIFFFLAKSQTDENPQEAGFFQHEARDCTKGKGSNHQEQRQGCKGFDQDEVPNRHLQSIMLPLNSKDPKDPVNDKVVLKVKDLEAREETNLNAATSIRVCEQGKDKSECHGGKPAPAALEIDLMHADPQNTGEAKNEELAAELRPFLLCMLISFISLGVLRCKVSLILLLLGCCVTDQIVQWGSLVQCSKPIHAWLLVMYATACIMRLAFRAADKYLASDDDLPWYLRHSKTWRPLPRVCMAMWALVPLPFIAYWSILGISWLNDVLENSPESVYDSGSRAQVIAVVACLIFNLLVIVAGLIFVLYACTVSRSCVVAEEALNAISDADLVERWGPPQLMLAEEFGSGMDPAEIIKLPCDSLPSDMDPCCAGNCAICLTRFAREDRIRRLPACKHEFHRPCIDQWLLRMASCPLCLAPVTGDSQRDSSTSPNPVAQSPTSGAIGQASGASDDVV
jgi:E3 ubiquitin-protein ligase RNF38/44